MEINEFDQLEQIAHAFGILYYKYNENDHIKNELYLKLYRILGIEYSIKKSLKEAIELCDEKTLYIIIDQFQRYHVSLLYDKEIVVMGPFVVTQTDTFLSSVMETNQIPIIFRKELQEYYNSLPLVRDLAVLESLLMMNMRYFFGENAEISRAYIEDFSWEDILQYDELQLLEENKVSMDTIEYRYKIEDSFMEAISSGDVEKVLEIEKVLTNYRLAPRLASQFRNDQNALIILNTLMRRAVQNADVHPAHIDSLSTDFANKIEAAQNTNDLLKISREMPRKYCLLVQNHSLMGHSKMVRDVMNYIDFNLNEDLSLNAIADKFSVNASYLSKQFKKENEINLTEYVNRRRIGKSLKYIAATDLPVQNIAELVGIFDENYFSRLFKKYQQMSPSNYRKLMKSK